MRRFTHIRSRGPSRSTTYFHSHHGFYLMPSFVGVTRILRPSRVAHLLFTDLSISRTLASGVAECQVLHLLTPWHAPTTHKCRKNLWKYLPELVLACAKLSTFSARLQSILLRQRRRWLIICWKNAFAESREAHWNLNVSKNCSCQ